MNEENSVKKDWKYYLGLGCLAYSFIPYLAAGALWYFRVPMEKSAILLGIFIASAELSFLAGAALLGKTFIEAIKSKIRQIFKPRSEAERKPISKARHYTGIALLILCFLPNIVVEIWLYLGYPRAEISPGMMLSILLLGDALFVISLFVLGGEFWEKLKKLFEWRGVSE